MNASLLILLAFLLAHFTALHAGTPPDYAPAPPDNPLKGFAPYAGQAREFPHSLEFNYLPMRAVMSGPDTFDWQPLERLLSDVAGRGCQTVFRFYLEYPNKPVAVPQFLLDAGVRILTNTVVRGGQQEQMLTPDYEDTRLRAAMTNFIAALGAHYDGDPRVGFITAGLLGKWGEWHDHPFSKLWASKSVQREVMDSYAAAFKKTPVLLRYPAAEDDPAYAANHTRPFGYHDDSFAWATMPTGREGDSWFFLKRMQTAGPVATNKWRAHPIGGEVRPEVWRGLWDEPSSAPKGQEFLRCVEETHATWLMDSSIERELTAEQRERAVAGARRLGYEFYMVSAGLQMKTIKRELSVLVTLLALPAALLAAMPGQPNFIFILGEGHGWSSTPVQTDDAMPASQPAVARTPNMEKLAAGGMRFANFYAPSLRRTPSRVALFTGNSLATAESRFLIPTTANKTLIHTQTFLYNLTAK